jgi:transcriptional regulator
MIGKRSAFPFNELWNAPVYIPRHFSEESVQGLHALMREAAFATLISAPSGGSDEAPWVSHLPLLLDPEAGERGTLYGHVARANRHWRCFDGVRAHLAVFHGPHTYVSPSWYAKPEAAVPTWNYAVVHAHGPASLVEARERSLALLARLVAEHEARFEAPWSLKLEGRALTAMLDAIVWFEIPISRLEGKFKLSQNRQAADRAGVIAALERGGDSADRRVAALMRAVAD